MGYNGVVVRTPPHSAYSESVRRRPRRARRRSAAAVRSVAGRPADVADDLSPPACRCGPLSGISGHFPHSSNYFRSIDSTSGLPRKPQTKRRSTTAYEVQRFRQSAVVFPPFSRHFALSDSKMAAKTTSGSGFNLKFRLDAPGFLLESEFAAVYLHALRHFSR